MSNQRDSFKKLREDLKVLEENHESLFESFYFCVEAIVRRLEKLEGVSTHYTEEELNEMCDKAELDDLQSRCLVAYWDNERFNNSLIDAPERLQAVFKVLLGWMEVKGPEEGLKSLREAAGRLDNLPNAQNPRLDSSSS